MILIPTSKNLALSEKQLANFVAMLSGYLPLEITRNNRIRPAVDRMLASLEELASPEVAAKRAEVFGIADPKLLAERVLLSEQDRVVIAGLRFRKLNPAFPFVHLMANFTPSEDDLLALRDKVAAEFAPLSLQGVTIRQKANSFADLPVEKWSHLVFGETSGLRDIVLPHGIRTEWNGPLSFYAEYKQEYEVMLANDPKKNTYLRFEDEEDLQEATDNGLLLSIWDSEGWVGLVAGKAKELYGLPCVYIFELFLKGRVRGQRLAGPLQALFLSHISSRFPYVYGHINDANPASLRTALSLGRRVIETEYFLPMV